MTESAIQEKRDDTLGRLRWTGLAGTLGAILLFSGDLLYLYNPNAEQSYITTLGTVPAWRLVASGVLALVACWFYLLGSGHLYYALQPAGPRIAAASFASFAAIMVAYGISHAAYFAIGAAAQVARQLGTSADAAAGLPLSYYNLLLQITYIPVAIATVLLVYAILFRPTRYPRWMILFIPTFLYLAQEPIVAALSGVAKVIVSAGYSNLIILLFYAVSTVVLWNGGVQSTEREE
jgi:uncharacterized protein DUF6796